MMVFMISTMGIVDHTMGIVDFAPMVSSGRPEKNICLLCPVSGLKGAMKGHMKTHYVFVELLGDLAVFGEHDFTACQTAQTKQEGG
jgi:hypothetical protein